MFNSRNATGAGIGTFKALVGLQELAIFHFSDMELILFFTSGFLGLIVWLKLTSQGIFSNDEEE